MKIKDVVALKEIAYVVAVLPMRRDPLWIKRRIEERS